MVNFQNKRIDQGALHVAVVGKIDETLDAAPLLREQGVASVVLDLSGIRSISSLGVRAFENFVAAFAGRKVVLTELSPAVASQLAMIPNLVGGADVESTRLPFVCPSCGAERAHSIPFQPGAATAHAPRCDCGARMELDGIAEQYLPS
jgi:anti-anti-sigma regulatory factor